MQSAFADNTLMNKKQRNSRAKWALKAEAEAKLRKEEADAAKKKSEILARKAKKDAQKSKFKFFSKHV